MQGLAGVEPAEFLAAGQEPLLKLEIWVVDEWINLCDLDGKNYVQNINISLGGAGMTPNPVQGTWSATIFNKDGVFHPGSDSEYKDYLKTERRVKISVGAMYDGAPEYWQRIIGYMDIPVFSAPDMNVSISGGDYMKRLRDTELRMPDNYFGTLEIFDSESSEGTLGGELYDEFDAMEIEHEDDNVDEWTPTNCAFISQADAGAPSGTHVGQMTMIAPADFASVINTNAINANVTAGKKYKVAFEYKRLSGSSIAVGIYQTVFGADRICGQIYGLSEDVYTEASFYFTALKTGIIEMWIAYADLTNGQFRIDKISIKEQTTPEWYRYEMPVGCEGIFYVTLDEEPVWPGEQNGEGWYYDATPRYFYFDEDKDVDPGDTNLRVYYYTVQAAEDVVAALLAKAGVVDPATGIPYDDAAAALATLIAHDDYVEPDVQIEKVWFNPGTNCLDAMKKICERCDYRFYFDYDGAPVFRPKPTADGAVFSFTDPKHIASISTYQVTNEIKNRIVIEGNRRAESVREDETMPSHWKGEAADDDSIDTYGERTLTIKNHLFQTQDSIDHVDTGMCGILLAEYKDPKWYSDLMIPFNPVPLGLGDNIQWKERLSPTSTIPHSGIIRDIKIDKYNVTYKCVHT